MNEVGVKETMEVLEALNLLAMEASKVLADGKISIKDLPVAFDLLHKMGMLKAGVEGADLVLMEVKDLSQEESALLLAKVFEIVGLLKGVKA